MNAKETILVVDDTRESLKLLVDILSGADYQVRPADSGEGALAAAASVPPDLIMLDVRMPDIDGIDILRRLKAKPQTADVPVILMSGVAEMSEQVEGLELGAMDFITKPFKSRELLARVQNRLEMVRLRRKVQQQAAQLEQSAELLQNTLKSIGDAVISTDVQGRVVQLNPVAAELTGWSESEAWGKPLEQVFRIINEQTREPVENPVAKVFREKRVVGLANHTLLIAKDGSECPIADSGAPIHDKQGAITGVVLVFRDQTAERAAEQALQKSEALFRSTIDDLRVGVVVHSADSSILISNPQASHILGPHKEQMLGKKAADPAWHFVHEDLSVMNVEDYPVSRVISTKKGIANQILGIKRADREEITWVSLSAVPVFSDKKVLRRIITNFLDITERKQASAALRESEKRFRRAIVDSPFPIMLHVEDGEILQVSNSWCEITGYTHEELATIEDWTERAYGERKSQVKAYIDSLYNMNHRVDEGEYVIQIKSGGTRIWDFNSGPVGSLPDGRRLVMSMAMDITERKQAGEALRASEEKFRALYDNAPLSYQSLDEDGCFLDVNPTWQKTLGYDREEVLGQPYADLLHPDWKPHFEKNFPAFKKRGYVHDVQFKIRHKDGHYLDIEFEGCIGRHPDGRFKQTYCVFQDITARKQAEEVLQAIEARQAKMVANIGDVIVIIDRDGINRYKSPNITKWFGWKPEEVIGCGALDNLHPDDADRAREFIGDLMGEPNRTGTIECRYRCKDGTYKWIEFTGNNLLHDSDIQGILGNYHDITERKRAEEEHEKLQAQLAQAQKLESVGRLAGGVAHDFNNLLMGIMNYAELCRDKLEPDHPIREWLDEITMDTERSAKLTHQLLAFARKQVIAPKVIDLNDAIGSMLKLLRRLIGEDITINWRPGLDVWPVKMDPVQIDQILANLAVNARDAIGGVGSVVIETGNVTFDAAYCADHSESLAGDYALLTFSDSGCGMDEETRENIFEPFFTTKGQGEGTGLGLATAYGIVKQNNGVINVYSEPGQGTTFKIYLPRVAVAEAVQAASVSAAKPPRGTETVLLVEDEKAIRVTTHMFLENLGYTVLVAENPKEALRLAADHPDEIDLLITDVVMPGMSGRDLATRLSELRPAIRCIFISGFTRDVIAQRGILDDGVNFLSKPFGRDALAHKVREVLDGQ